jgi:hypothetical protein
VTTPALAEVTEELVSALRRALSVLEEAAAVAAVPVPREPEPSQEEEEDLGGTVRRVLAADAVRTVLEREVLGNADPAVAARVIEKIETLRQGVIAQVDSIPFVDELQWTLTLSYAELKSQWLQRQVRVCYEEMITGSCNPEVALEASAASYLMGLIEPLLDPEQLQQIQQLFVSQASD